MEYLAGFIGSGNMGSALLCGVAKKAGKGSTAVYDINKDSAKSVADNTGAAVAELDFLAGHSKFVFLAVKPNVIESVCRNIRGIIDDETVIVSMAAGVSICNICAWSACTRVIRIMPNTPASVGEGMILYCKTDGVNESDEREFLSLMSMCGRTDFISESLIDAAAALSGCGPAFVYMFIDALADGAVSRGLARDKALLYAKQTVLGAAKLALYSDKHPDRLKDDVCSPGGTTIEGVLALEKGRFRSTVSDAVIAAYEKTAKLGK